MINVEYFIVTKKLRIQKALIFLQHTHKFDVVDKRLPQKKRFSLKRIMYSSKDTAALGYYSVQDKIIYGADKFQINK